jgi:hypothetical protein
MSKRIGYGILSTLVGGLFIVSVAAAHDVRISQRAKIGNGPELDQGTYRVEVEKNQESAEVVFFQGEDLVATTPATLTKEAVKCDNTQIHSEEVDGGRVITKIWLQGWKESLVFKLDIPEAE